MMGRSWFQWTDHTPSSDLCSYSRFSGMTQSSATFWGVVFPNPVIQFVQVLNTLSTYYAFPPRIKRRHRYLSGSGRFSMVASTSETELVYFPVCMLFSGREHSCMSCEPGALRMGWCAQEFIHVGGVCVCVCKGLHVPVSGCVFCMHALYNLSKRAG